MKTKLDQAWAKRRKLYAEGIKLRAESDKLYAESDRLRAESDKLYAESDKLRAEIDKLCAEIDKLRAEGNLVFANAVISVCGKTATMEWSDTGCIVCGVMEFLL